MTLDLGAAGLLRLVFDLVAGGEVGLLDALALSALGGLAVGAILALAHRPAEPDRREPGQGPRSIRGPRSYAGPGSLGGTDSALRR